MHSALSINNGIAWKSFRKALFLACVGLPSPVLAQTVTPHPSRQPAGAHHPRTGTAASPHAQATVRASNTAESISVHSAHRSHGQISIVSADAIRAQIPGASPLKALNRLPGVMFNSTDAMGLDIWSLQLYMRGFDQTQIGMSLDGMPLGEMVYRNYNGLSIGQAISSQNIAQVVASPVRDRRQRLRPTTWVARSPMSAGTPRKRRVPRLIRDLAAIPRS